MPDMVGWKTSSIRRELDLRKVLYSTTISKLRYWVSNILSNSLLLPYTQPLHRSVDGYKHIVNVEYCSPVSSDGPHFPSRAARAKEAAQSRPNMENTEEYHKMMEGR
jgi:hypothetical protein